MFSMLSTLQPAGPWLVVARGEHPQAGAGCEGAPWNQGSLLEPCPASLPYSPATQGPANTHGGHLCKHMVNGGQAASRQAWLGWGHWLEHCLVLPDASRALRLSRRPEVVR